MMQNVITRETGYARNASESAYPNLWRGLAGWWCPSINPRGGNRLFDLSPFQNHGTLVNMANDDWVVSNGQGALDLDGTNDNIQAGSIRSLGLPLGMSCFIRPSNVSGVKMLLAQYGAEGNRAFYLALINNAVRILLSPDGTDIPYGQGGTVVAGEWVHIFAQATASNFEIYLNGVPQSVSLVGTYPSQIFQSTANFFLGDRTALDTPLGGLMDDARIYRRVFAPSEIRLLASKRGIGLQPRPKQYTYTQQPSGSRRRRILTGMA